MFLVCLGSSNVHAVGIGLYGSNGAGSETWDFDKGTGLGKKDTTRTGFGFVLDTNVSRDSLFNYQLNLGFHQLEAKPIGVKLSGYSMAHDFGFGVLRNNNVRLWLGPELKINYFSGSQSAVDNNKFDFGIGPVVGVNLHLGDLVSLSLKGGYLFNWGAGYRDYQRSSISDSSFTSNGGEPFITFSIIFRLGELVRQNR